MSLQIKFLKLVKPLLDWLIEYARKDREINYKEYEQLRKEYDKLYENYPRSNHLR